MSQTDVTKMGSLFRSRHLLLFTLALLSFSFLLYFFHTEQRLAQFNSRQPSTANENSADDQTVIIYNRIPKTASTTFMHIPYELCKTNDFNVLLINNSRPQHFMSFKVRQVDITG